MYHVCILCPIHSLYIHILRQNNMKRINEQLYRTNDRLCVSAQPNIIRDQQTNRSNVFMLLIVLCVCMCWFWSMFFIFFVIYFFVLFSFSLFFNLFVFDFDHSFSTFSPRVERHHSSSLLFSFFRFLNANANNGMSDVSVI